MEEVQTAGSSGFVGRDSELAQVQHLLNRAASGISSVGLVSGPPGVGKSALLGQAARIATDRDFATVWGRCWEVSGAPPYWPWSQVLRAALTVGEFEADAEVAAILPELQRGQSTTAQGDPEGARFRLFVAVEATLRRATAQRPLLILLDDLHQADESSLLLLSFLTANVTNAPVCILGAFRDPDPESSPSWRLPPVLRDLFRQPQVWAGRLNGLARDEVAAFVLGSTGRDLEQNVIHQLYDETDGNPLFLGELVRLLEFEGRLDAGTDLRLLTTALPPTVSEAISRRLRHISAECRELLVLASVLGRDFDLRALTILAGGSLDTLQTRLDEALRAGLVSDGAALSTRMRFGHALIRDALYQTIAPRQRRRLHLAAGDALENLYRANVDDHLAELAFHYLASAEAERRDKGIDYAQRAARRSVELLAFEEGVRLYRLAIDTLRESDSSPSETQGELLLGLGDAQARSGDTAAAQRSFLAAADLARRLDSPTILASSALGYGGRLVWATPRGDPNLVPLLREALAANGGPALRCRLLARLSGALREEADASERDSLSKEAVEIARTLDDPATLAYALSARYPAIWGPDDLDERFAIGTELLAVGREAVDKERIFHGHTQRLYVELERGEMSAAREDLAGARDIARALSQPSQLWLVGAIEAELAIFEGHLATAEELAFRAHAIGLRANRSSADIAFAMQLFVLRREQGRMGEVAEFVRVAIHTYAASYPVLYALEALTAAELDAHDQALTLMESLRREEFQSIHRNDEWLPALTLLAEATALLPDSTSAAEWVYSTTLPYADRNVLGNPELLYGSHSRVLGLIALKLGRLDNAVNHLQSALTMNQSWGGGLWAAHCRLGLADALIRRGADEDVKRAQSLLQVAQSEADKLPSTRVHQEAARLQTLAAAAPTRQPTSQPEVIALPNVLQQEGESWQVEYAGVSVRLKDTIGLRYLARLLSRPGQSVHALDLVAASPGGRAGPPSRDEGLTTSGSGLAGGTMIDAAARAAYKTRLAELDAEIDEAQEWNDPERAARASEQKDFLVRELTAAFGLGGVPRSAGDPGERARQSATKALKTAIDRISRAHDQLGEHLRLTVRTGTYFSYNPDPRLPIRWQL